MPKWTGKGEVNRRQDEIHYTDPVKDSGYTKTCHFCGRGHVFSTNLIGRPREIQIEACDPCKEKPYKRKKRKSARELANRRKRRA